MQPLAPQVQEAVAQPNVFGIFLLAEHRHRQLTGWPDRDPAGPFGAYTDYIAPKYTAAVLLAAIEQRRRTGEGQYIDLSQAEASIHFLGPALLDYFVNGRVQQFTKSGQYLRGFGGQGTQPGQFYAPHGLAFDRRGHLYVVDAFNHRVQKFAVEP